MTLGRKASTAASTVASAVTERSHTETSTPRSRNPRVMRSTVTALPRTEGKANGVSRAIRDAIGSREYVDRDRPSRQGPKNPPNGVRHLLIMDGNVGSPGAFRPDRGGTLRDRVSADRGAVGGLSRRFPSPPHRRATGVAHRRLRSMRGFPEHL